ncbi:MAG: peptidyl-dipeptidase A [Sphingobacteriales bacterium]|jgi:peptidyl-dipeptidase A
MKFRSLLLFLSAIAISCNSPEKIQQEAQDFLDGYTEKFLELYAASSEAEWAANTKIIDGDTTNTSATAKANEAYAQFTGSEENIKNARKWLEKGEKLKPIQVKQFESILYKAANNPATVKEVVSKRIKAESAQNEALFGFDFKLDGESLTANEIDGRLRGLKDLDDRKKLWEASKEVGQVLKPGLLELRDLRNQTVQALGYDDYFGYQVSDYGMTTKEMMDLNGKIIHDLQPLYRELHTWMRYTLAEKYHVDVPEMLPAHWLPNRWGQDWSSEVEVEGIDLDDVLEQKDPEWLVKQSERFYMSLGFEALPPVFYEKSSLYPLPEGANYKKNNHASAWHMDLKNDVRSLMSVEANSEWYETTHHELGHIYYYLTYTNPDVPPLLRGGANRAFHEGIGSMMGLAAMQKPFLEGLDLIEKGLETDDTQSLLKEALNYVVFIPWSAGVMTGFENEIYSNSLSADKFNVKWWELKKKYQGIVPPTDRGEEYCDASSKTHINNDAAQYYDYALSYVLLFQLHNHIAKNFLDGNPRATNYYGNKEIGKFLHKMLYPGASTDWRELLKETTGEELGAQAMLDYFEPLMDYLREQNKGRKHTI